MKGLFEMRSVFLVTLLIGLWVIIPVARLKQGVFLLAVPELRDPNFSRTVILLTHYDKESAMGVIINRPTDVPLKKALPDVEGMEGVSLSVFFGGPVSRNLLLAIFRPNDPPQGAQKVFDGIYYTGNKNTLLDAIRNLKADKKVRVYAGYAGWGPGQLDREVMRGDWIVMSPDAEMVFSENPSDVWDEMSKSREQIEVRVDPGKGLDKLKVL